MWWWKGGQPKAGCNALDASHARAMCAASPLNIGVAGQATPELTWLAGAPAATGVERLSAEGALKHSNKVGI